MESKKFTLIITCYGKYLSSIENVDENNIRLFIKNYKEPLPEKIIEKALGKLQINETEYVNWNINKGKLLAMIPKYHREIKLIRLS